MALNGFSSPWTDERVATLVRLWTKGYSGSQIADRITTTRNAVIGKANRLKLPPRATVKSRKAGRPAGKQQARKTPTLPPPRPALRPPTPPAPAMRALSFAQLEPWHCRWGIGDPKAAKFLFCAADVVEGRAYCGFHLARVRVPGRKR